MSAERVESKDRPTNPRTPWSAAPLFRVLERLDAGQLTVTLPNGSRRAFEGRRAGPVGSIALHRPLAMTRRVSLRGALGLAESHIAGDWSADNLSAALQVLAVNQMYFRGAEHGKRGLRLMDRLRHLLRSNSLRGSRRNIAFHYDLGNDFYRLWLDETMSYSSAVFVHTDEPLPEAQTRKYQAILDRLEAQPGDHILEIGCGWGGFASHAARQGYRVTGITLSREQLAWARRRMREEGLADRVNLELRDYRHVDRQFDHIVSIEMFEAVGEAYWPTYFETVARCLKPGGRASLQVITIDESRFDYYRRNADFIQCYVFPGGMLPSVSVFDAHTQAAGLATVSRDFYGADYAHTLRRWDEEVTAHTAAIREQGYDERFLRLWHYYLAYCEIGFRLGRTDVMQVALEKPAGG